MLRSVTEVKIRSEEERGLNGAGLQLKLETLRLKMNVRMEVKAEELEGSCREQLDSASAVSPFYYITP